MKKLARDLRAGDVILGVGSHWERIPKTVLRRVSMRRSDWNHAVIYFREGGSTTADRDQEFSIVNYERMKS